MTLYYIVRASRVFSPLEPLNMTEQQANDQVEIFMLSLYKVSQTVLLERKDWKLKVYILLFSYYNFPFKTNKILLSDLMFNRKVKFAILHIDKCFSASWRKGYDEAKKIE